MTEDEKLVLTDKIERLKDLRHAHDQTARCEAIGILYEVSSDFNPAHRDYGTITTWFIHDCIEKLEGMVK